MTVLVSDTSVIIDLERGEMLETVFRLEVDFAVPDLLFHRELAGPLGDQLLALGLRVEELLPGEVQFLTQFLGTVQGQRNLAHFALYQSKTAGTPKGAFPAVGSKRIRSAARAATGSDKRRVRHGS